MVTEPPRESDRDTWMVDSGASSHMCQDLHRMYDVHTLKKRTKVAIGDGKYLEAVSRGKLNLTVNVAGEQKKCTLHNVLCVPKLAFNLLSISKATERGKQVSFTKKGCEIRERDGGKLIAQGVRRGDIYYLDQSNKTKDESEDTRKGKHVNFSGDDVYIEPTTYEHTDIREERETKQERSPRARRPPDRYGEWTNLTKEEGFDSRKRGWVTGGKKAWEDVRSKWKEVLGSKTELQYS